MIVSCSTTNKNVESIDNISNEDFKKTSYKKYVRSEDYYPDNYWDLDLKDDLLYSETLDRVSDQKVKKVVKLVEAKVDTTSQGQISKLAAFCHASSFDLASNHFDDLYRTYKKNPSYWNQVGTCYLKQGEIEKALIFYNKAKSLDKSYSPAINNIGVIYQLKGNYPKAKLAYEKAIKENSVSLTPVFNLAQILLKFGFTDNAIQYFKFLQNSNMRDVEVTAALASAYLLSGDLKNAKDEFERLNEAAFKIPFIGINYSITLKLLGQIGKSKAIFLMVETDQLKEDKEYYKNISQFLGVTNGFI